MKKAMALVAGVMLFVGSAFAAGYVNANDLDKGTFTSNQKLEDNFVLTGTAEKPIVVDNAENAKAKDGEVFTQRINTKGAGSATFRSVAFPVKKGEKITVYGASSSKTDTRQIVIANDAGERVGTMDVPPAVTGVAMSTFTAPATGTLYAYSAKSGVYIYQIKVE